MIKPIFIKIKNIFKSKNKHSTNIENFTFDEDCFGRKDFAKNILELIKNQREYESRIIAIKADFGLGKTYFAKALQNMIQEEFQNTENKKV